MLYARNVFVVLFLLSVVLAGIDAASLRDKCKSDDVCKEFQYICDINGKLRKQLLKIKCVYGKCHCEKVK
ncbi:unnamed protein product [Callosobruchus maculatus]|uniref:Uncharacterized protein n=1 Tax=Callosobruchus maculatus TaxID=64391 RepID=A0A653CE30_CALMS|nr:unnamed protein product [Callosobruchus maculatus]